MSFDNGVPALSLVGRIRGQFCLRVYGVMDNVPVNFCREMSYTSHAKRNRLRVGTVVV